MAKSDGTITFSTELDNTDLAKQCAEAKERVVAIENAIAKTNKARESALNAQAKAQEKLNNAQLKSEEKLEAAREKYNSAISKTAEKIELAQKKADEAKDTTASVKENLAGKEKELSDIYDKIATERTLLDELEEQHYQRSVEAAISGGAIRDPAEFIAGYETDEEYTAHIATQEKKIKELEKEWDKAKSEVDKYSTAVKAAADNEYSALINLKKTKEEASGISAKAGEAFAEAKAGAQSMVDEAKQNLSDAKSEVDSLDSAIKNAQKSLEDAENNAGKMENKLKAADTAVAAMKKPADAATEAMSKLGKRIAKLAVNALVFQLISKELRSLRDRISTAIQANEEASQAFANLKGAVLTAMQPIIDVAIPILTTLANLLTRIITLTMSVFGKDFVANSKKAAQELDKAAKSAERTQNALMGFDEINKLSNSEESSSSEPNYNFDSALTEEEEASLDKLATYVAGAALAIGVLLCFSGVDIPLGLGLIVAGAGVLGAEIAANWDSMDTEVGGAINTVLGIIAAGGLVIGAILAFTGVNIPLGIGLMLAGAGALGTAVALNWDSFPNEVHEIVDAVKQQLNGFADFFGGLFSGDVDRTMQGLLQIFSGARKSIFNQLELLQSGFNNVVEWFDKITGGKISGSLETLSLFVNKTIKTIKQAFGGLVTFLEGAFTGDWDKALDGLAEMGKALVNNLLLSLELVINNVIGRVEGIINGIVSVANLIPGVSLEKVSWKRVDIPLLAQGAVLPANHPFMAVVGDQKHGTNVEAPLETIQEAVALVMEDNTNANMAGFEALQAEIQRLCAIVESIEVGDSTIGQAANRYNQRMSSWQEYLLTG